jgi:hypothetical protein
MNNWRIRVAGLALMVLGGILFIWSVKYVQSEWPQIFSGLLSVFSTAMGFALLIMPLDLTDERPSND